MLSAPGSDIQPYSVSRLTEWNVMDQDDPDTGIARCWAARSFLGDTVTALTESRDSNATLRAWADVSWDR